MYSVYTNDKFMFTLQVLFGNYSWFILWVICKKWNAEWNGMWNGIWNGLWNTLGLP